MTNDLGMNIFSGENHKMISGNYGALFPPKGFELTLSLPWRRKNFSLQCLYIEKETSDENKTVIRELVVDVMPNSPI